jgi:hypothetical protein
MATKVGAFFSLLFAWIFIVGGMLLLIDAVVPKSVAPSFSWEAFAFGGGSVAIGCILRRIGNRLIQRSAP